MRLNINFRFNQPTNIFPAVSVYTGSPCSLSTLLKEYNPVQKHSHRKHFGLIHADLSGLNLAYCDSFRERKIQAKWLALEHDCLKNNSMDIPDLVK